MTVVVVGPHAVVPVADPELVDVALACIDDGLAVHADRIVPVRELWCEVAASVLPQRCARVTLVVPSWWSVGRAEVVEAALLTRCADVVVRRRAEVLRTLASVVVERDDRGYTVYRGDDHPIDALTVDDVLAAVSGVGRIHLDGTADELQRRLERRGVDVIPVTDDDVREAAAHTAPSPVRSRWPRIGAVGAAVGVAAVLAAAAVPTDAAEPTTWVVEGRVTVETPRDWTVQRVVAGPGSARVQVVSPDRAVAIHLTQAVVPPQETLHATALALRTALTGQPADVFTDFTPDDVVAGRPAVTYREVRAEIVDWTVVVDDGVRIAVGCRDGSDAPTRHPVCEHAIRTAHAIGGIDSPTGGTDRPRAAS